MLLFIRALSNILFTSAISDPAGDQDGVLLLSITATSLFGILTFIAFPKSSEEHLKNEEKYKEVLQKAMLADFEGENKKALDHYMEALKYLGNPCEIKSSFRRAAKVRKWREIMRRINRLKGRGIS